MKLSEAMKNKMLLSFELFPPKTDKGMENLPGTIEHLCKYQPEYISCTYGAGGTNVRKEFGDKIEIAVAGSPEGHIACRSLESDIAVLKQKQDNGADYIMTQLCWDMEQFKRWMDAIRTAGITMPVDVGIMPILDQAATINMALSRNGCVMPRKLCEIISKNWIFPNPFDKDPFDAAVDEKKAAFKEAGIEYTIRQIDEYRALGVNGIHLYALNKWKDVSEIIDRCGLRTLV